MSAYIIEKEDAAYLAAMAMAGTSEPGSGGLEWWFGRNGSGRIPEGDLVMAAAAANVLWRENMISVVCRYGDPVEDLPGDRYVEDGIAKADIESAAALPFEALQVLKACACYAYQSCEHPGWEASEAHAFIQALKDKAIRALPGYGDAVWGAPDVDARKVSDQPEISKCPVCGSEHIEGGFVEICGAEAVQGMSCTECGAGWDEAYAFSRRDNIEP